MSPQIIATKDAVLAVCSGDWLIHNVTLVGDIISDSTHPIGGFMWFQLLLFFVICFLCFIPPGMIMQIDFPMFHPFHIET